MQQDERSSVVVRAAEEDEMDQLARLWYDGWRDAHEHIVPPELARLRTLDSFKARLQAALPTIHVAGAIGSPVAFFILKGDELYQFYVDARSRGTGVAAVLIADAEARLLDNGVKTAWLSCAIGNDRAARFYEKRGWRRVGTMIDHTVTYNGTFPLKTWRYEKELELPAAVVMRTSVVDSDADCAATTETDTYRGAPRSTSAPWATRFRRRG